MEVLGVLIDTPYSFVNDKTTKRMITKNVLRVYIKELIQEGLIPNKKYS